MEMHEPEVQEPEVQEPEVQEPEVQELEMQEPEIIVFMPVCCLPYWPLPAYSRRRAVQLSKNWNRSGRQLFAGRFAAANRKRPAVLIALPVFLSDLAVVAVRAQRIAACAHNGACQDIGCIQTG